MIGSAPPGPGRSVLFPSLRPSFPVLTVSLSLSLLNWGPGDSIRPSVGQISSPARLGSGPEQINRCASVRAPKPHTPFINPPKLSLDDYLFQAPPKPGGGRGMERVGGWGSR